MPEYHSRGSRSRQPIVIDASPGSKICVDLGRRGWKLRTSPTTKHSGRHSSHRVYHYPESDWIRVREWLDSQPLHRHADVPTGGSRPYSREHGKGKSTFEYHETSRKSREEPRSSRKPAPARTSPVDGRGGPRTNKRRRDAAPRSHGYNNHDHRRTDPTQYSSPREGGRSSRYDQSSSEYPDTLSGDDPFFMRTEQRGYGHSDRHSRQPHPQDHRGFTRPPYSEHYPDAGRGSIDPRRFGGGFAFSSRDPSPAYTLETDSRWPENPRDRTPFPRNVRDDQGGKIKTGQTSRGDRYPAQKDSHEERSQQRHRRTGSAPRSFPVDTDSPAPSEEPLDTSQDPKDSRWEPFAKTVMDDITEGYLKDLTNDLLKELETDPNWARLPGPRGERATAPRYLIRDESLWKEEADFWSKIQRFSLADIHHFPRFASSKVEGPRIKRDPEHGTTASTMHFKAIAHDPSESASRWEMSGNIYALTAITDGIRIKYSVEKVSS